MNKLTKTICAAALASIATFATARAHAQLSDDDKKFLATAAQADVNEIKLSQLAEEKATNPDVKAFAHKMVVEHKQLDASMAPFIQQAGITPPTDLDDSHKTEYQKLSGLSGHDFDKRYIDDMVSDHTKAYSAFTTEGKDTRDPALKTAVLKGKAHVAAHKNMAWSLQKKM